MRELRRQLPANIDAEVAVCGGILFAGRALHQVADMLEPGHFYDPRHEAIFAAFLEIDRQGRPIDLITVAEEMRRAGTFGKLSAVGEEAFLADLANRVATTEAIAEHARIVREKSTRRRLALAADQISELAYGESDDFLDQAQQAVFNVMMQGETTSYRTAFELVKEVHEDLQRRYQAKRAVTGVATHYRVFDYLTAGLQPGDLIIVAGRPSMGKSALALNIAKRAAMRDRQPSLVFSLEMADKDLIERVLGDEASIPGNVLRTGRLDADDWRRFFRAGKRVAELPITVDHTSGITLQQIRARARRWRTDMRFWAQDDPPERRGLIIVDYLQLMGNLRKGRRESNREQEVSENSRGLKCLARELKVPIIAIAQLNRGVETRQDKRPTMADLRESGAIEQDADLICFIYRDEVYNKDSEDKGVAEIIIGKQRKGACGTVRLAFEGEYTRFEDLEGEAREQAA